MSTFSVETLDAEPLAARLGRPEPQLALYWLGQAGFALAWREWRALIDPYLSDHLARKYAGHEFSHERMMAAPLAVEDLARVDLALCTHRHGDHLDPVALPALAARRPECRFVVPAADLEYAHALGLPAERLTGAEAGRVLTLAADLEVLPLPAAHEELETDPAGRHRFLGYVITAGPHRIYHSGDCVPYPGLDQRLRDLRCDLALLPVNGRDAHLGSRGIAGNFTLAEAADLCRRAAVPVLIAHHHGMFAFNTVDPARLDEEIARATTDRLRVLRALPGRRYVLGEGLELT